MYQYNGPQCAPTAVERQRPPGSRVRRRPYNHFRSGPCYLFPSPCIPEPIVRLPTPDPTANNNPIEWSCPRTTDEAESLMVTERFWGSVAHKQVTEQNRIQSFSPMRGGGANTTPPHSVRVLGSVTWVGTRRPQPRPQPQPQNEAQPAASSRRPWPSTWDLIHALACHSRHRLTPTTDTHTYVPSSLSLS